MKILFQGDSVTDSGRDRSVKLPNNGLGTGYVNLVASRLLCDNPGWEIYNRAIAGNRIGDMYARWIEDTLNIDFDILSVMNGINDVGFGLRLNMGASCEEFEFMYDRMISQVKEKNPNCKVVLLEPFITRFDNRLVNPEAKSPGDIYSDWDIWQKNISERGAAVERIAKKHNAVFIPLFEDFCRLSERDGAKCWSLDGIHPTPAGHEYIARKWIEYCKNTL